MESTNSCDTKNSTDLSVWICFNNIFRTRAEKIETTGFDNLPPGLLKDAAAEIASTLAHIINLSLRSGQVPSQWKIAEVIPLHKSGNTGDNNNFRPISILPAVSKILEKAVHHQLMNYICLLYTSPSPRDKRQSRMPSSA